MFSNEDEILLEQYITYENMTKDERDICVNLILHTKEVNDSSIDNGEGEYKIVGLNFKKKDNYIVFNGSALNDKETRILDGIIFKSGNKYIVADNIYRMYEYLEDDERFIRTVDYFSFKNGKAYRKTNYEFSPEYYECEYDNINNIDLYEYYDDMIHPHAKKLKNTID